MIVDDILGPARFLTQARNVCLNVVWQRETTLYFDIVIHTHARYLLADSFFGMWWHILTMQMRSERKIASCYDV